MITLSDEWKAFTSFLRKTWANAMGVMVALILGILLGIVYKQSDIVEDCRYAGSFRVGTQAFNCQRKM
jgi:hypothetical protein